MNTPVKLTLIGLAVGALVVNQSLRTEKSTVAVAFGTSTARSDAMNAYCANAQAQLTEFLESNNFTKATDPRYTLVGRGLTDDDQEWFEATALSSLPFYVRVSVPQSGSSGLECAVVYHCSDYRWRVKQTEAQADSVTKSLTQWWDDYQSSHPPR